MSEWEAAAVEPGDGKPTSSGWEGVDVPGRPPALAGAERVGYRTRFPDPRGPDEAMAVLRLDGLYDGGTVWVDGERVADTDSVVEPVCVPFEPEGETEVLVACDAPDDRFGGIHDTDRVPTGDSVPGIWWGVDVTTHPATFVLDVATTARTVDGGDRGVIDAVVRVFARDGVDDRLTLTTRPVDERRGRGMMDRTPVEGGAGEVATAEKRIELRDPSLWYPRGLGAQDRYEVRAKLGGDVATATTGFATVTSDDERFTVNGERCPVRGVVLQDGTPEDVERALDVNANLVRAHAHALPPAVYEACDAAGVLVWQDLPLTGPGTFDVDRGCALVESMVDRYNSHPSLAAVTVHDEPSETFATRVDNTTVGRLRLRWRLWRGGYDRGPADAVGEAVPEAVATVPVVGDPASDPDAAVLCPGWDFGSVDDLAWLRERFDPGDVVGEFGAGSLATADPETTAGFDRAKHDAVVDNGVQASQGYQARAVRAVAERLRADGAPVVVANALRDTGDAGMGVYGHDGDPKRAAAALATAFEPLRAVLPVPEPGEREAVVVNDTPHKRAVTLAWAAVNGEERVADGETELTVRAAGRATAPVTVPAGATAAEFRVRSEAGSTTVSYDLG